MAGGNAGKGRPRGVPNKVTSDLKAAILMAAEAAGRKIDPKAKDGMTAYLTAQAAMNPGPFLSLLGKVLPTTLAGDPENPVNVVTKIERTIVNASDRNS